MSNIYNRKNNSFDLEIINDEYMDFCLEDGFGDFGVDVGDCLVSDIDANDSECIWFDKIYSKKNVVWEDAYNNGLIFKNIGLTGVDNGLVNYDIETITNEKFLKLFFESEYEIPKEDVRLILNKVYGNHGIYDYSNDVVEKDGSLVFRFNGGFYQGFWKHECDYQTLPFIYENGMDFEITLNKSDLKNEKYTLNDKHPENKGIFLYLGTRAENKWVKYYDAYKGEDCSNNFFDDEYIKDYYKDSLNDQYIKPIKDLYVYGEYIKDDYLQEECKMCKNDNYVLPNVIKNEYYGKNQPILCDSYFQDDYLKKDIVIDTEKEYTTNENIPLDRANYQEIKTNNKFLLFNKTKDGFTTENWEEGTVAVINDIKIPNNENGFLLFNKTKDGYTTETIDELYNKNVQNYNIFSDIYYNCLAFQITDNGEIGYKYLVKDSEEELTYKVLSEFSEPNKIKNEEWYKVHIKLTPSDFSNRYHNGINFRIMIYVNNKLVLLSEELKMPNFRKLKEITYKQEGVPFNISLGGGTQGLAEVVYINYREKPDTVYPIEKYFAGSFIGYIKNFRIFNCNKPLYG